MADRTVLICPCCGKFQGLRKFAQLFISSRVRCDHCGTMVRYRLKKIQYHGPVLGIMIGIMGRAIADLSIPVLVLIGFVASLTLQRFIDVWSGLEAVPREEL